jgi:hypothetical protein
MRLLNTWRYRVRYDDLPVTVEFNFTFFEGLIWRVVVRMRSYHK